VPSAAFRAPVGPRLELHPPRSILVLSRRHGEKRRDPVTVPLLALALALSHEEIVPSAADSRPLTGLTVVERLSVPLTTAPLTLPTRSE
jgi:hypothetical protein